MEQAPSQEHRPTLIDVLICSILAVLAALWLSTADEWVPAGPFADEPGMGQGSDWDRRWQWAVAGGVSRERGFFPHWDPFLNFGTPLFSEPESFISHPAYALIAPRYGIRAGLNAVYGSSCVLLFLGLAWLGWRLRIPALLAMTSGLFLLLSDEWFARLGSGHPMVLGICAWPMAAAATLAAMDPSCRPWEKRLLLASIGGLALGLAGLCGAHYPVSYGILMVVLLTWSSAASGRSLLLILGLVTLPLIIRQGPAWARYPIVLVGWTLVVVTVLRAGRWRDQITTLIGIGLGILASAGFFLVSAAERASQLGRLTVKFFHPPGWNPAPLAHLVETGGDLESYLSFAHPGFWLIVIAGIALLSLSNKALAAVSGIMLALAWSLGLPLRPWELVSVVPGMAAADLQMRMQWIVLIMAPIGLAAGISKASERLIGWRGTRLSMSVAAVLICWFAADRYQLPAQIEGTDAPLEDFPQDPGRIHRLNPDWAASGVVYSRSALRGEIIPIEYGDPSNFRELAVPDFAAGRMAWLSSAGELRPAPDTVRVSAVLNEWTIEGPPGETIAVPQRDLPGWSCEGGELNPDLEYMRREREAGIFDRDPMTGMWFLSVRIGQSGKALCRWHTPGLGKGISYQVLALLMLSTAIYRLRRRARASTKNHALSG
ncbi:MAG: hypothetical protein CMP23_15720 [Rickettsiales bacterium]|nr:hypothetical protein [Rickettsiales bacterium]